MYYFLCLVVDVYSRKRVGWSVETEESMLVAARLIEQTCGREPPVFAEQEGVGAGTLYSWSRRVGIKRSKYGQRSEKAALPPVLPVVVAPSGPTARPPSTTLEIVFPDGTAVRVPPTFDEDTPARVVRALEGVR